MAAGFGLAGAAGGFPFPAAAARAAAPAARAAFLAAAAASFFWRARSSASRSICASFPESSFSVEDRGLREPLRDGLLPVGGHAEKEEGGVRVSLALER